MTASGCVPWESLTKRTPSMSATVSSRCSTPVEGGGGRADGVRGDAEQQADRDRGQGVARRCARPGWPSSPIGMIRPPGPVAAVPAAGQRQALHAVGHDPAIDDAEAAGHRPRSRRYRTDGARAEAGVAADDRVLGVEHERAVGVDQLGEPALDPPVRLERAVPVEVVRRDVRVDRDGRAARQRRQLQLGQLVDDPVVRRQLGQPLDDRRSRCCRRGRPGGSGRRPGSPRSARRSSSCPWCRSRRSSGPRTGAGTGRARRRGPARSDRPPARAATSAGERRAEARLGRRVVGVDRRRRRHERRPGPGRRRIHVRPEQRSATGRPSRAAIASPSSSAGRPS